jgi:hypothetical protein
MLWKKPIRMDGLFPGGTVIKMNIVCFYMPAIQARVGLWINPLTLQIMRKSLCKGNQKEAILKESILNSQRRFF